MLNNLKKSGVLLLSIGLFSTSQILAQPILDQKTYEQIGQQIKQQQKDIEEKAKQYDQRRLALEEQLKQMGEVAYLKNTPILKQEYYALIDIIAPIRQLPEDLYAGRDDVGRIRIKEKHVYFLELFNEGLTSLSPKIGELQYLVYLNLSMNLGMGPVPKEIGNLINVEELCLSDTGAKVLPEEIGNCKKLKKFYVSRNRVVLPKSLQNLKDLEVLYAVGAQIPSLENIPSSKLKELVLTSSSLNSLIGIGNFRELERGYFAGTKVKSVPTEIKNCTKVKFLDLSYTEIDILQEEIGHIDSLEVVYAIGNNLNSLPKSFINARNLEAVLCFEGNNIPPDDPVVKALLAKGIRVI